MSVRVDLHDIHEHAMFVANYRSESHLIRVTIEFLFTLGLCF